VGSHDEGRKEVIAMKLRMDDPKPDPDPDGETPTE
jgi:hypothetical protein